MQSLELFLYMQNISANSVLCRYMDGLDTCYTKCDALFSYCIALEFVKIQNLRLVLISPKSEWAFSYLPGTDDSNAC